MTHEQIEQLQQQLKEKQEEISNAFVKIENDPRVTKVGKFIRKFSIDELPQLINVLLGQMSLVGPRPPIPSEVATYTLAQRKRLNVTPGITCTWQVSGRSNIPFEQQVKLDTEYIQTRGFWKDCMILLKTIPAVLTGDGSV